ncbi:MAG TPA: proteasome subunit alpha [Actinomycetota bacterium]
MSPMPYYVSPEQLMRDKADYARKGISRGKSMLAVECAPGIVMVAENPSTLLNKISEVYDRIAFGAVGKYNEFESFRKAGVRLADMTGFAYGREDVTAKAVANAFANALGTIFTEQMKPYEIEILVAQVGERPEDDEMYRVLYDGSLQEEQGVVAMGGHAEALMSALASAYQPGLDLDSAVRLGATALANVEPDRPIGAESLEVAVLDRERPRRAFRRFTNEEIATILRGDGE